MNLGEMGSKLYDLLIMTKPRQLLLLAITMYGAYLASTLYINIKTLLLLTLTAFGAIGGVTALNMYLEVDIDSRMRRTQSRPLVRGSLSKKEALAGILALIFIGLYSALLINKYVALSVIIGLYSDIILYTDLTKRRTPINILLGGVAGGMPALGGWAAGRGRFDLPGLMLSAIVMAWIPMHIWFISYYYKDDYERARVPMAPVVMNVRDVATLIKISLILMSMFSWLFMILRGYGVAAALTSTALSIISMRKIDEWAREPTKEKAREMFKFASPVLATVFMLLPLDYRFLLIKSLVA
jgi:protoheme IX farnesyltransferase